MLQLADKLLIESSCQQTEVCCTLPKKKAVGHYREGHFYLGKAVLNP